MAPVKIFGSETAVHQERFIEENNYIKYKAD
jgi:hypothetical protein